MPDTTQPGPIITASMLRHLLICERRVWLDAHEDAGRRDPLSPEAARLYALGLEHEEAVQHSTAASIQSIPIASWEEGAAVTRDLMAQRATAILGAHLECQTPLDLTDTIYVLRGVVDRLVVASHDGRILYAPVEIKRRTQPDDADWLQLDLYVWLLSMEQGATPPAELWLGADDAGQPRRRLPHEYDEERLMLALTRLVTLLRAAAAPDVQIEPHCKTCPWFSACTAQAQQSRRVDLLYGVSRQTRANMQQAGIVDLAQVAAMSLEDLQQVKGIGPATAPAIRANAQAWLGGQPVFFRPLPDEVRPGWMFDLETVEVRGKTVPWCMGWCDTDGHSHIALIAPVQLPESMTLPDGQAITLVPDSDSAWEVLADHVARDDGPIYHWTGYDAAILRGSAPAYLTAALLPRMHDLHATIKRSVSFPLKSTSIKAVSIRLGFPWPGYNDWFAAYLDYRHWLESGQLDALVKACTYQRADVQSMAWVWRWLVAAAPSDNTL